MRTATGRLRTACGAQTSFRGVTGQEHLTGPEGVLTRPIASGLASAPWSSGAAAGTGKTTVARLLAGETDLAFEQISAIFPVSPI